jgi:DNA polymerase-3 subunit delta
MTFAEFQKALAEGSVPPVLVFHGEEPFLASLGVDLLKRHLISPGSEAFDFVSLSGSETTAEAIAAQASTVPMLSERRLAIVYEFLGLAPSQRAKLLDYVSKPVPSSCVALVSFERLNARNKFESALLEACEPVDCGRPSADQLDTLVRRMFERRGREIDDDAVSTLLEWTDGHLNTISNELDKLDCFAETGAPIGLADVEAVVGVRSSGLRDLALAVAEGRTGAALALLDELADGGLDEAQLVSRLFGFWISLWLARSSRGGASRRGFAFSRDQMVTDRRFLRELASGRTSRDYARGVGCFYQADVDIRRGMPPRPTVGLLIYELTAGARQRG